MRTIAPFSHTEQRVYLGAGDSVKVVGGNLRLGEYGVIIRGFGAKWAVRFADGAVVKLDRYVLRMEVAQIKKATLSSGPI